MLLQSIMIDIIVMLFTIVRSYFPSELRWTPIFTVGTRRLQLAGMRSSLAPWGGGGGGVCCTSCSSAYRVVKVADG